MSATPTTEFSLPDLLRQPREALRALQDRLLRRTIELCYDHHPFYSQLMRREKLEPRHIQSCEDLVRLPPSSKTDFLGDPDAFRLRGEGLTEEEGTLWKVIYTTGTTSGRPAPIYVTAFDHFSYLYACSQRQELIGLRETDLLANLFPLTTFPMGAYARAPDEIAAVGAAIALTHTGRADISFPLHHSLDDAVRNIARHRATVLWGVAGFVRRVLIRARDLGADLSAVRMVMITGEASSRAMREDMRRRMAELGCADTRIVNRYGSTEQGGSMVECTEGSGFHSLAPDQIFHEVVEPETGRRLADGESGMLAFTHLARRGTLFLRYMVGDVVTMSNDVCPHCARTSPRISSQPVRTGDIVKIKGTLVNLQVLKEELDRFPSVEEYQIVVRRADSGDPFSADELAIRLAVAADLRHEVGDEVTSKAVGLVRVTPRIEFAEANEIYDPLVTSKPRRIVDLRQLES
jgi:phenylacetate-CoA ligase